MTTPSKEDVVRWAALSGAGQRGSGYGWNFMGDEIVTFANLARADLVAENKRIADMWVEECDRNRALVAENERLKATPPDQRHGS